jgi:hypothetical protein
LTRQGAAELLGIDQSKISRITRGQFRGVSEAQLLELVAKLGHDVKIVVLHPCAAGASMLVQARARVIVANESAGPKPLLS